MAFTDTQDKQILAQPDDQQSQQPDPNAKPVEAKPISPDEEDPEEIEKLLLEVFTYAEKEDLDLRYNLIRQWKRNDYYFNNIQKIFFDGTARDFRSLDAIMSQFEEFANVDDIKTINIYRATAESLVAALSIAAPNVEFTPDDAEEPKDLDTAEAYSKIAELVSRHNNAQLMLVKALVQLYNTGVIFGYNYFKTDPAYGTVDIPSKTRQVPVIKANLNCATCGETIEPNIDPSTINPQAPVSCPLCGAQNPPQITPTTIEYVEEVTNYEKTPKGRAQFDIFSPTYVKVSLYARNQPACGYVILRIEDHIAKLKTIYETEDDKVTGKDGITISAGGGDTQLYERWGRIPIEYAGTMPKDMTTLRTGWLRPWYFNVLDNKENASKLIAKYPDGVKVSVINDQIVDIEEEKLDDRWTISIDPRANFIHAEPAGNAMIPLQDSENDIFNLGLQSIEYGIPETYVHPKTVNLNKYKKTKASPGMMVNAVPYSADTKLADAFYQSKTAVLSSEYTTFAQSLTAKEQFVSGSVPSIFGGTAEGQPQTATVYTESRNRALQRLQLTWQVMSVFWNGLIYKCCRDFAQNLRDDVSYAKKQNGTFVNVWIRKSQLEGSVGHVEPETNGQLPQSWGQKKDFIMSLVQMVPDSPVVAAIMTNPNNAENLKQVTGMPDFYIPGENDAKKQWAEYYELSVAKPNGQPPDPNTNPAMQEPQKPSVLPDIDVDDHDTHMKVLKNILVSPVGTALYNTNPAGYQNCILHYREHEMMLQAKTIAPASGTPAGTPEPSATAHTNG